MEGQELVTRRYLAGESVAKIAQDIGVSRERVYQILRPLPNWKEVRLKARADRMGKTKARYRAKWEAVKGLIEEGYSMEGVAKKLNIPYFGVRALLKGTPYDKSASALKQRNKEIRSLKTKGWSTKRLCDKYNIKNRQLNNILSKKTP